MLNRRFAWLLLGYFIASLLGCINEVGERDNPFDQNADLSDYERDVHGWSDGKDGEVRRGNVSHSCFVYENDEWRYGNESDCDLGFGGCTKARQDSLRLNSLWYKCDNLMWRQATSIEVDTAGWGKGKDGEVRSGQVNNEIYYIYENNVWKRFYGNESVSYGKLIDERDGNVYRTVKIGDQTWMAENLIYADSIKTPSLRGKSWCYNDSTQKSGETACIYTWAAAIDSAKLYLDSSLDCGYGKSCDLVGSVQGICPNGWHLPSDEDWKILFDAVGGQASAGKVLKSLSGWYNNKNGTDSFGFSVFPASYRNSNGVFVFDGKSAFFWSSTESEKSRANRMYIYYGKESADVGAGQVYLNINKDRGFSIRCVKD